MYIVQISYGLLPFAPPHPSFLAFILYLCPSFILRFSIMSLSLFLAVGAGSAVGGTLRYALALLLPPRLGHLPWHTLLANVLGALLLGLLSGWAQRHAPQPHLQAFLTVGLCGGFTTFSTLMNEHYTLHAQQFSLLAWGYLLLTLLGGWAAVALGHRWAEWL